MLAKLSKIELVGLFSFRSEEKIAAEHTVLEYLHRFKMPLASGAFRGENGGEEFLRDPYEVLGVSRDASDQEIKSSYRKSIISGIVGFWNAGISWSGAGRETRVLLS